MGIARNIARLIPNGSGLLPNANIEAVAATKLTGILPDANAPSGSVIQVVEASRTTPLSFTTVFPTHTSFISGSITTTIANSKVLVLCNVPVYVAGSGGTWSIAQYFKMLQNGSLCRQYEHNGPNSGSEQCSTWEFQHLTAAQSVGTYTFSMEASIVGSTGTVTIARTVDSNATKVSLLMMEIAP